MPTTGHKPAAHCCSLTICSFMSLPFRIHASISGWTRSWRSASKHSRRSGGKNELTHHNTSRSKVAALLKQTAQLQEPPSPVYGEKGVILSFRAADPLSRAHHDSRLLRSHAHDQFARGNLAWWPPPLSERPDDLKRAWRLGWMTPVKMCNSATLCGGIIFWR